MKCFDSRCCYLRSAAAAARSLRTNRHASRRRRRSLADGGVTVRGDPRAPSRGTGGIGWQTVPPPNLLWERELLAAAVNNVAVVGRPTRPAW